MAQDILQNNLFFLSSALYRKLRSEANEVFATTGLSYSHALILVLVHKDPEIQPSVLAERMHLKPSTVTRLVQKLETHQLVKKESNGRAISIACTSEGGKVAEEIEQKWHKLVNQKKDELGDRYVDVLSEMIANALDEMDK